MTLLDNNRPAEAMGLPRGATRARDGRNRMMIVSPFDDDFIALLRILNRTSWIADWWTNCADAIAMLRGSVPVIVCDADLPAADWRSLLARVTLSRSRSRFILTARSPDERLWAEALNLGAYDVLAKPFSGAEVIRAIGNAWHTWGHGRW